MQQKSAEIHGFIINSIISHRIYSIEFISEQPSRRLTIDWWNSAVDGIPSAAYGTRHYLLAA